MHMTGVACRSSVTCAAPGSHIGHPAQALGTSDSAEVCAVVGVVLPRHRLCTVRDRKVVAAPAAGKEHASTGTVLLQCSVDYRKAAIFVGSV